MTRTPPRLRALTAAAATAAVLLVVFWWSFWSPKSAEERKKTGELQRAQARIRKLEQVAAQLPKFQAEGDVLRERLAKARRRIPQIPDGTKGRFYPRAEIDALEDLASDHRVAIEPPVERPIRNHAVYYELPMSVEVKGDPSSVASFIHATLDSDTSLVVNQVEFLRGGPRLTARLELRAHRIESPEQLEPRRRGRRGRRRRGR